MGATTRSKLDQIEVCKSYATPFPDDSFDLVFAFSAAHHFGNHEGTLKELRRLLRPGGSALYFHEPSSPRVLLSIRLPAKANAKGCDYHEDVLIPAEMIRDRPALRSSGNHSVCTDAYRAQSLGNGLLPRS